MKIPDRRELASELLAGYVSGPAAATEATAAALAKTAGARAVILVEGISDQIALETLAVRRGRDLGAEGVVVLPIGGIHAVRRYLRQFGPDGAGMRLAGLCDAGEENILRRGLAAANVGSPRTRADMEHMGFHVCVEDLEDELIRAVGAARIMELLDSLGDRLAGQEDRSAVAPLPGRGFPAQAPLRTPARRGSRSRRAAASTRFGTR